MQYVLLTLAVSKVLSLCKMYNKMYNKMVSREKGLLVKSFMLLFNTAYSNYMCLQWF